jgi:hypothetical protein
MQEIVDVSVRERPDTNTNLGCQDIKATLLAYATIHCPTEGCEVMLTFTPLYVGLLHVGDDYRWLGKNPLEHPLNAPPQVSIDFRRSNANPRDQRPMADCGECGNSFRMTRWTADQVLERAIKQTQGPQRVLQQPSAIGLRRSVEDLATAG